MANERSTEEIVRTHLKEHPLPGQRVEEQTTTNPSVKRALAAASKSGSGVGKPEFIITFPEFAPRLVIVVECKASPSKHESPQRDRAADFSVDGVLHYSSHLSRQFDVIGIAVSGTNKTSLKVSTFRQLRGDDVAVDLPSPNGAVKELIPVPRYHELLTYDPAVRARTEAELIAFSRTLHNYMRDYAKLSESEKPLVVSGILLALRDEAFKRNWSEYKPKYLAGELYSAIDRVAKDVDIKEDKRETMLAPYAFVRTHPELSSTNREGETPLRRLIGDIDEHVRPFLDTYHDVDVIGQFYGEFLRYTGGDKKGLGIVLTPRHLTELFAKVANVGPSDVVIDTCAGTGGFLISAMAEMDAKSGANRETREEIRKHHLIGVEQQPHMFALAASNMILRGDGKANLYRGSCFDVSIKAKLKNGEPGRHKRPTVGLINPPFSQKGEGLHELDFVETLLDSLAENGTAVVVVPMSCAIESHPARERILKRHTLVAVMSLPNDLFHPVGVITCAMVFKAHQPHAYSPQPTWFGYWKDDGFIKTKDRGRIDLNHRWASIRDRWLEAFHSRIVEPGLSISRKVSYTDEWCAEAYMETDYSQLSRDDFEETLRKYAVFRLLYANSEDPEAPNPAAGNAGSADGKLF
ncbi:SAM-dependent DNA methyltransferase [Streptomyces sp. MBT56]|uniref:HsdM family class I SAM-dependent methyltransferase n=1 Tax=unclassified Streptomyces TaxID=2593676 RepID=UPI00190E2D8E|nr:MULTISPECIES: N-6 DNA methylase [unclassified Streptomyces]MBK3560502.1 SAM-dependent DNA methyltransferase [Streptomyces sp. MBT56]MBK3600166.1 SAM-dependent DNA methyltransferase [Streptomyces sp. MBT54]MBK3613523.1 SAM-dependent DNA methyltransferase [Streptomyces sp. MBT98]